MRARTAFVFLLLNAGGWGAAAAAAETAPPAAWQSVGPWGGPAGLIAQAASAPDTLYATTQDGGLYVTATIRHSR